MLWLTKVNDMPAVYTEANKSFAAASPLTLVMVAVK